MRTLLYAIVAIITKIHDKVMQLNNAFEANLSDKDLHFLVIGLLGLGMIFVIYPLFKYLAKRNHEMVIAWIYVTTVLVVITFAIEIGQKLTDTGNMEFADIMYGLVGFMVMFFAFCFVRGIYHGIQKLIRYYKEKDQRKPYEQYIEEELNAVEEEASDEEIFY
jgi:hypothetical protein